METESSTPEAVPQAPAAAVATSAGIFLVEETLIEGNGESAMIDLGPLAGKLLSVVLGIQESVEQQSLELTIWGSADGEAWQEKPLLHLPQKFYAGVSELLLDLEGQAETRFVKAKWTANRWGRGSTKPAFRAYVFLRPA